MKPSLHSLLLLAAVAPVPARGQDPRADSVDATVKTWMARRHIAGLSLAIIDSGRIVLAKGYGVRDTATREPVTTATLFQAGSISKPVSALGALHLVEAGALSLDADVNDLLTTWKVPTNRFTATEKVTLRRLLSHSAGVTVHGFPGYAVADPMPSLVQVLEGTSPANTPPIRVDTTPGAIWRYSGGGFTIMQQLVLEVTGQPFAAFLQQAVLGPIGMTSSSFEQPQPSARHALMATGYYADRSAVRGRWHIYPEIAAAGLWTTPTDLARFAIEIQETLAGKGHGVISPAMARQFVTEQKGGSGLGIGTTGAGRFLRFSHGGRDEGFDAQLVAYAETGQGAAVMINANDDSRMMGQLIGTIGRLYGWANAVPAPSRPEVTPVAMSPAKLAAIAGYYEAAENQLLSLVPSADGSALERYVGGFPDERLVPVDSARFASTDRPLTFSVAADAILWGPQARRMPRVAPLPSTRTPPAGKARPFPYAALFEALGKGGEAIATAPGLTEGARKDFTGGGDPGLKSLGKPVLLGEERVAGRGLRRHGGEIALVRYYRITTAAGIRYLLVHLTADGLVTDYDLLIR